MVQQTAGCETTGDRHSCKQITLVFVLQGQTWNALKKVLTLLYPMIPDWPIPEVDVQLLQVSVSVPIAVKLPAPDQNVKSAMPSPVAVVVIADSQYADE